MFISKQRSPEGNHAGHFVYNFRPVCDRFFPGSSSAYLFSKPLNRLEFNHYYPKNPNTLGEYIRKWRMEQGISRVELAETVGVDEMTIVNWEIKGGAPSSKYFKRLRRMIPGLATIPERLVLSLRVHESVVGCEGSNFSPSPSRDPTLKSAYFLQQLPVFTQLVKVPKIYACSKAAKGVFPLIL